MKFFGFHWPKRNRKLVPIIDVETHPAHNGTSLNEEDQLYQKGLIITDDIAIDPILDFNLYRDAIVNIVKKSYPKFTIGIFGDWGTGKTTLMNSINKALQNDKDHKDLVTVQFETWRYEREEQFVLIPLLKTIAFSLPEEPKYENLKGKLKRGAITFLKKSPEIVSSIVTKHLGQEAGEVTKAAIDSFREQMNAKVELLTEVDRDTLYFDGFEGIKKEIDELRGRNPAFRIVVFVDDLDRCSPTKTLEVLESMKVFLGMEGFIYIVGISHDIVSKLIDIEYEKSGVKVVKGEQYIKKMIQIPITLPKWNNEDIIKLVKDFVKKGITHAKYKKDIDENIDLISTAIENNPREIKRFLNNFIVAFEIFSPTKKVVAKELLVLQAIQLRWGKFYDLLIKSDKNFRIELKKYVEMDYETRLKTLDSKEVKESENYDLAVRRVLRDYKEELELWNFLSKNSDNLNSIKEWNIYRRATEVSIEPTTSPRSESSIEAFMLLRSGKVDEFNRRRTYEFQQLDLTGTSLVGSDLREVNLRDVNLRRAYLVRADLVRADLVRADLEAAELFGANLEAADLAGANLEAAYLAEANLAGANLAGANLVWADFSNANLAAATLSYSIIINPRNYGSLKVNEQTEFKDAIIDDSDFIDYISKFKIKMLPEKIKNQNELKMKLEERKLSKEKIKYLLAKSKLRE